MSNHSNKHVVLDASSLIALLSEEKGQEIIAKILPLAVMSAVNVAEVVKFLIERKGLTKEQTQELIQPLIQVILPFDEEQAFLSSVLITETKHLGLSFGDRACISLGLSLNYPIYTADKAWSKLKLNCDIKLIR